MLTDRAQQALAEMGGTLTPEGKNIGLWVPMDDVNTRYAWVSPDVFEAIVAASCAVASGEDKGRHDALNAVALCRLAMRRSVEEGATAHLDSCDDAGAFWYNALALADDVLGRVPDRGDAT